MFKILRAVALMAIAVGAAAQPSADDLARRLSDALGGAAWAQARYFAFTFNVERDGKIASSFKQRWDRMTGNYRVSGTDPYGQPFEIIMNTVTKRGRATLNGAAVTDEKQLSDLIANLGYVRFVNDTFWLRMPLSIMEASVHRTYDGERSDSCGRVWDLLQLKFDEGGLQPNDTYWAWLNRDTGIVEEWDMRLQSMTADARPMQVMLHDYRRIAGVLVSLRREIRDRNQIVRIDDLQILPAPPRGAFD